MPTTDDVEVRPEGYGWSPEVQRKLVALCFRDPLAYGQLGPGVFDAALIGHVPLKPVAEEVFKACQAQGGRPPSPEMVEQLVSERLRRIKPAQAEATRIELRLVLTADVSDALLLRAKAAEVARNAALEKAVMQAAGLVESGAAQNGRGPELVRMFEDALAIGRPAQASLSLIRDEAGLRALLERDMPRTPTGLGPIDRALGGGAEPGLHVVAGDAKLGKTSLLSQIAVGTLRQGKTVWYISGEVTLTAMARRCVSAMTGMTKAEIKSAPGQAIRLARAWRQTRGDFLIEYQPSFTVAWVSARLRQLEAEGRRVDLIVADFLDLMGSGRRYEGDGARRHELAEIGQGLRDLGVAAGVPIWSGKAMNRKAVNKAVPTEADLGECYQIAFVLDSLFVLCATEEERRRQEIGKDGKTRSAPILRIFHALGRESEDKQLIAAYRRDNDRQRWIELLGYDLTGKGATDGRSSADGVSLGAS